MENNNKYSDFDFSKGATNDVVKGTGTWGTQIDSSISTLGNFASSMFGKGQPQAQIQTQYTPPPKSNAPIIIGAIVGLVVIGGAIYFFTK